MFHFNILLFGIYKLFDVNILGLKQSNQQPRTRKKPMKMTTIGDFISALEETDHLTAKLSIQIWREATIAKKAGDDWEACMITPLTMEGILSIRNQMSDFYADRLRAISLDKYCQETILEHAEFIKKLDFIAAEQGYMITVPRKSICLSEAIMRNRNMHSFCPANAD